ncbi:MAG: efflux RND transporter periplasmic adaptor subunit [Gemmatimonadaceae bacterium]
MIVIVLVLLARRGGSSTAATARDSANAAAAPATGADTVITLDSTALRLAGVTVVAASISSQDELVANGTIVYNADRVAVLAPRAEGRISAVQADLGQEVSAGQVLAIIESPDVGETRGDLERARATVSVSKRNYEREKRLFEQEISPQKEMLDAEVIYRSAEADYNSALAKLRSYGATSGSGGSYGLRTAVAGTVVERNASPGAIVGPTSNIFTVADLRHVWIVVDVYETDLKRVHRGASVKVTPTALPGETFVGRVTFAGGVVDSSSHTIKMRVTVENESKRLRPGMFAQVRIAAPAVAPAIQAIALPEIAVQDLNGKPVVFVQTAPGRFVARSVTVGPSTAAGSVLITRGVRAGDQVVVQGAFQLKSELLKASFGGE